MNEQKQYPTREQLAETLRGVYDEAAAVNYHARRVPFDIDYTASDAVLALFPQPTPSVTLVPSCGFDTEAYASAHNDGWDAAVAQEMQDHPVAFAAALRAAADRIEQDARLQSDPSSEADNRG